MNQKRHGGKNQGFLDNSPACTKMAINQKVLDVIKQGSGYQLGLISEKNTYINVQVPQTKGEWIRSSTVGRNAYIIGFLQNFTPGTEMAINQKVLDIF